PGLPPGPPRQPVPRPDAGAGHRHPRPDRAAADGDPGGDHDRGPGRPRAHRPRPPGGAAVSTGTLPATSAPTPAREALNAARAAVRRRWTVVVTVLVLAWVGAFLARTLLGDFHITVPDALRILGGTDIPRSEE